MNANPEALRDAHWARELVARLRLRLQDMYGERLKGLYLFGSHARGTADVDSDVDVLVVLDRIDGYFAEVRRTGGVVAELSLEHAVTITPVFVPEQAWRSRNTVFLANVRAEGIAA